MAKNKKVLPLAAEDIKKYLSGTALNPHEVERKMLDDGFSAEAMEGFEAIKKDKVKLEKVNLDLKAKLAVRIAKKENKAVFTWKKLSLAASLLAVLGFSFYYFQNLKPEENLSSVQKEKVLADTIAKEPKVLAQIKPEFEKPIVAPKTIESKVVSKDEEIVKYTITAPSTVSDEAVEIFETEGEDDLAEPSIPAPAPAMQKDKALAKAVTPSIENVSGKIVDAEGVPIPGAMVRTKGSEKGTQTDTEGNFSLPKVEGQVLEVNSIGYEYKEILANGDLGKIVMKEDAASLSEVVVTGYESNAKRNQNQNQNLEEPKPLMGWSNFDSYLRKSLKETGAVTTLNFENPINYKATIEITGKVTNVQIENKELSKEESEKLAKAIENGPNWQPATKKGRKIRKEIRRVFRAKD
jgi:CarboxypepD_reg-like domain